MFKKKESQSRQKLHQKFLQFLDFIQDNDVPGALKFFDNPSETDHKVHSYMMKSMSRNLKQSRIMRPSDLEANRASSFDDDFLGRSSNTMLGNDQLNVTLKNYK